MSEALNIDAGYERVTSRRLVAAIERLYALEHPSGTTSLTLREEARLTLSSLRGLGAEVWAGEDAQAYVNGLREEWA
jgi:hypothetical protein